MQETEDLSDEDEDTGGEESSKRLRVVSGDDLGDSFSVDAKHPKKGWIDEVLEREGDEDDSASDEDSESEGEEEDDDEDLDGGKGHSLKDWEQSDDELEAELEGDEDDEEEDDDDDDEDEEEAEPIVHKKSKRDSSAPSKGTVKQSTNMKKLSSTQHDIPYVIHAPQSFEELIALVEDRSNADVITIVNRIRTTDSIKLAAENRKKMQVIFFFFSKISLPFKLFIGFSECVDLMCCCLPSRSFMVFSYSILPFLQTRSP